MKELNCPEKNIFRILENKIKNFVSREGEAFQLFDPSRRGVEIAAQVVRSMTNYSRDPQTLYRVKKQVIDEILDLDTSPLLIVQTNPPELTKVHDRAPIEVFGLTDPGAKITGNGKQLPVSSQGFFGEIFYASLTSDTIFIEVESENGKKCIMRKFDVVY